MKVGQFIASQKELLIIAAIVSGLGIAGKATHDAITPTAPAVVNQDVAAAQQQLTASVVHLTDAVTQQQRDVQVLSGRVLGVMATMDALVRVECVRNRSAWRDFELAGIRCRDLVPRGGGDGLTGGGGRP